MLEEKNLYFLIYFDRYNYTVSDYALIMGLTEIEIYPLMQNIEDKINAALQDTNFEKSKKQMLCEPSKLFNSLGTIEPLLDLRVP